MIIIGHAHIPSENFIHIASLSELETALKSSANGTTTPNTTREIISKNSTQNIFWFCASKDRDFGLSKFCASQKIDFGVAISSIKECALYAQYTPKYLIAMTSFSLVERRHRAIWDMALLDSSFKLAKSCQKIAESYMLDSKILAIISDENKLESIAKASIDGAIFLSALK